MRCEDVAGSVSSGGCYVRGTESASSINIVEFLNCLNFCQFHYCERRLSARPVPITSIGTCFMFYLLSLASSVLWFISLQQLRDRFPNSLSKCSSYFFLSACDLVRFLAFPWQCTLCNSTQILKYV